MALVAAATSIAVAMPHAQPPAPDHRDITYILPLLRVDPVSGVAQLRAGIGESPYFKVGYSAYVAVDMTNPSVDIANPAAVDLALAPTFAAIDSQIAQAQAANAPLNLNIILPSRSGTDAVQRASEIEDRRNMQWYADNAVAPEAAIGELGADLLPGVQRIFLKNPVNGAKPFIKGNRVYLTSGGGQAEWITLSGLPPPEVVVPDGTYAFEITRTTVQGTGLHTWASGQTVHGASGWWGHSRYSRKARAIEEAYVRAIGRKLAAVMALHPQTLVSASGDGEIEMSYERSPIVHPELYTEASTVLADYSPFAVAEFRDWLRKGGLYAPGQPYEADAYANADRYSGAGGLAALNADFGTSFSTWNLRYGNWDLSDSPASDPNAIPLVGGTVSDAGPSAFDAPRVPIVTNGRIDLRGSAWWIAWELFRETMLRQHNTDFARWITTSPSTNPATLNATVSPDRWFSYQIPADRLYGATPEFPNFRYVTSASALTTTYIGQYGGSGITGFNANVPPVPGGNGPYYKTLQAAAPILSANVSRWAVLEWNPSIPKSTDPTVYRDEMRIVERYRPVLLVPFVWPDDLGVAFVKDTPFVPAMQEMVQRSGNVPATCRYDMTAGTASFDGLQRDGAIAVTATAPVTLADCPWTASSDVPWITLTGNTSISGTNGNPAVPFVVAANSGGTARGGTITLRATNAPDSAVFATVTITQAAPCSYALAPGSDSVLSGVSSDSFTLTTGPGCPWSVTSNDAHVTVTSTASGAGTTTVAYSVTANPASAPRSGSIGVTGSDNYAATFDVSQAPAPCDVTATPSPLSVGFTGASGSLGVSAPLLCGWSASSAAAFVTLTGATSGTASGAVPYAIAPNPKRGARQTSISISGTSVPVTQNGRPAPFDFDGDGDADLAAFAPGSGTWKVSGQSDQQLGQTGDVPVAGDYDGDGVAERAVFRPAEGLWIHQGGATVQWGLAGDIPVPADYDGDGAIDRAVVRTNDGLVARWYVHGQMTLSFGLRSDIPLAADFDGDGKADPAVFRPAGGMWFVLRSSSGYSAYDAFQWGLAGDTPLLGDFDGDGKADLAVYRPGAAYVAFSATGYATNQGIALGAAGYVPAAMDLNNDRRDDILVFDPVQAGGYRWNPATNAVTTTTFDGSGSRVPVAQRPILPSKTRRAIDQDADGRSDFTVYRPSTGEWYSWRSTLPWTVRQWGVAGDVPAPGDYDGDHAQDAAIFRPSNGLWFLRLSGDQSATPWRIEQWGLGGDTPVAADYDGDGRTDIAIYRPSTGEWWIRFSASDYAGFGWLQWGLPGDLPVPADYDGDGRTDFAIFRPSTGEWWVRTAAGAFIVQQWGLNGDLPLHGDFDGDGRADFAVYRPSTGEWYVLDRFAGTFTVRQWGLPGDTPVPGDYDGDGIADTAVYRPSDGSWYVIPSSNGGFFVRQWGLPGDIPIR